MGRVISFFAVVQAVRDLCIRVCYELPDDVLVALELAKKRESDPRAKRILEVLVENARLAKLHRVPLCQDTGLAVVFVEQGASVQVDPPPDRPQATILDAIQQGVEMGYRDGLLRKSVVADPILSRRNTGTNTPAIIHYTVVPGDRLHVAVMAKGAGCENKSQIKMFNPTCQIQEVMDWIVAVARDAGADACPPLVIGVGIGGNLEASCLLAKRALLRPLDHRNEVPFYAKMEQDLLTAVNAAGIGPQGMGGTTTALAVLIETAPCHIASLPVAVNIECHSHRHLGCTI